MKFNEDSRVKIPAILHLTRLGYNYLSLRDSKWDESTNIFTDIFRDSIARINPGIETDEIDRLLEDIKINIDGEDLGKIFFEKLLDQSGIKLIDFGNFNDNSFHVVTELTCKNGDEEFRPDVTLLINGMPLVFIEVKKPNNREGILAERNRIIKRFANPRFRKFINITQFMVFSNNMEYVDGSPDPIEGAFYATTSYEEPVFNFFREEEKLDLSKILLPVGDTQENEILKDNNLQSIKHSPEFETNKNPDTPTNRILTSLFCRDRLSFMLRYSLVYVKSSSGYQKHIMRYPQVFATKAIENKLNAGEKKGIIWHTQGSGKTALAFYNVRFLTDYFQQRNVIPKFYFIVDRLDLLIQAQREFTSRGLVVHTVNSRDDFAKEIKSTAAVHNASGKQEITVVNIQKFKDDPDVVRSEDYDLGVQRIYFLDEVHRSYNPKGSFLANLTQSDVNAIKIGLTGTPLLGDSYNSRKLFGEYIHKYYYNSSIADGYTLRLIREEIETKQKMMLSKALEEVKVLKGDISDQAIYSHPKFVEPMLDFIIEDFQNSRVTLNANSIGGMVVCHSSDQAKALYDVFQKKYAENGKSMQPEFVKEAPSPYTTEKNDLRRVGSAALILHDEGTKEIRKDLIEDFKEGKIDFLFVFNMLLTGFDAHRLKKLYLGRVIKRHNLLQTLTRVNRPYKDFRYGYVVDFADIRKEFDATNEAYLKELQEELGDEMESYSNLFKSREEMVQEIENIKDILFRFDTENAEEFQKQISRIQDRKEVQEIKKALGDAKSLYNIIRLLGHYEMLERLDFQKLGILCREASNHLDLLNLKENLEKSKDTSNMLNVALEDILFMFTKVSEDELHIADELKNTLKKTREAMGGNFDQGDPQFISLKEELERIFKKKKLNEITQEEMTANISVLNQIYDRIKELNRKNELLSAKYGFDKKYTRIHKRLLEKGGVTENERRVFEALMGLKNIADEQVIKNTNVLQNDGYFETMMLKHVIEQFKNKQSIDINAEATRFINSLLVKEYRDEFKGVVA